MKKKIEEQRALAPILIPFNCKVSLKLQHQFLHDEMHFTKLDTSRPENMSDKWWTNENMASWLFTLKYDYLKVTHAACSCNLYTVLQTLFFNRQTFFTIFYSASWILHLSVLKVFHYLLSSIVNVYFLHLEKRLRISPTGNPRRPFFRSENHYRSSYFDLLKPWC